MVEFKANDPAVNMYLIRVNIPADQYLKRTAWNRVFRGYSKFEKRLKVPKTYSQMGLVDKGLRHVWLGAGAFMIVCNQEVLEEICRANRKMKVEFEAYTLNFSSIGTKSGLKG
jgi:hypothetical protein